MGWCVVRESNPVVSEETGFTVRRSRQCCSQRKKHWSIAPDSNRVRQLGRLSPLPGGALLKISIVEIFFNGMSNSQTCTYLFRRGCTHFHACRRKQTRPPAGCAQFAGHASNVLQFGYVLGEQTLRRALETLRRLFHQQGASHNLP